MGMALTVLLGAALLPFSAHAFEEATQSNTYWVAPGGKDAGVGSYEIPFGTFGRAISYASDGDVIIAKAGIYTVDGFYDSWNADINCLGKRLDIRSEEGAAVTIIDLSDGGVAHRFLTFDSGETQTTSLTGFTIRNGLAPDAAGGGALLINASPIIRDCVFENCAASTGGAVKVAQVSGAAAPRFFDCTFSNNQAFISGQGSDGGAVSLSDNGFGLFLNCRFNDNTSEIGGAINVMATAGVSVWFSIFDGNGSVAAGNGVGGAFHVEGSADISQCTLVRNNADLGAVLVVRGAAANLNFVANMVTDNQAAAVYCYGTGETTTWSCNNFFRNTGGNFAPGSASNELTIGSDTIYKEPAYCPDDPDYAINAASECAPPRSPCGFVIGANQETCPLVCGDVDNSGGVDISDMVYLVAYMFEGGPAPVPLESGNVDCSEGVDISDLVYLVDFMFKGGPAPCDCRLAIGVDVNRLKAGAGGLVATYKDGYTTIHLDSPLALAGLEIEMSGLAEGRPICLDKRGVGFFESRRDDKTVVGFIDAEAGRLMTPGATDIVRIKGRVTIAAAVAIAEGNERVDLDLAGGSTSPAGVSRFNPAYPNPFNPMTRLSFSLTNSNHVNLSVYDVGGRRVTELLNESMAAGDHWVTWDGRTDAGSPVPAGVYFARFSAGQYRATEKLIVLK